MFGFIGAINSKFESLCNLEHAGFMNVKLKENEYADGLFFLKQKTIQKFANDKCFINEEDFLICIEGVIYNKSEICKKDESFLQLIKRLYSERKLDFVKEFNGIFSIIVFDKISKQLSFLSDHTSLKSLFYYVNDKEVIFSTDIVWLVDTIRNTHKLLLSRAGTYCLLSYGYMLMDATPYCNIKKLLPGQIVSFDLDGNMNSRFYYDYSGFIEKNLSYEELLKTADLLFSKAVNRIYSKDNEYGYKHICTLSGGLDSRSVLFTSYELGYKDQLTLTMAQGNTLDQKISQEIADKLNVSNFFYLLNNGNYLKSIERSTELNGGLVTYPGLMHSESMIRLINYDEYGAIHSGEIGDAIFGGHPKWEYQSEVNISHGAFSKKLIEKIPLQLKERSIERSKNNYLFFLLERGLNSTVNGWFSATPYTEYTSAFLDKDFLSFILTVPSEYRADSKFYIDWMTKYHPEMCGYKWEKYNAYPNANRFRKKMGLYSKKICNMITHGAYDMNPYNYWIKHNKSLNTFFKSFYNSVDLSRNELLKKDIDDLYNNGTFGEKTQALTLLSIVKRFQPEVEFND